MTIKVRMIPHLDDMQGWESGIRRVIEGYFKYLPNYDIELVAKNASCDIVASHAGEGAEITDVAHCHGLYWSADYQCSQAELATNQKVINALRYAKQITVPSEWVAETIRRDMRVNPHVIGHGIEYESWKGVPGDYVLWNKNRNQDVCDPAPVMALASLRDKVPHVSTFSKDGVQTPSNVSITGLMAHDEMKKLIEGCGVYLATTKETFGIGVLEAMAAGKPILGYRWGGNLEMVIHGVNGYLVTPGDYEDLAAGLDYCQTHAKTLGDNSLSLVKGWGWDRVAEKVAGVYRLAVEDDPSDVTVVIPCYNYGHKLSNCVQSVLTQTYPVKIIIVDDGSTDNSLEVAKDWQKKYPKIIRAYHKDNGGVATARNYGIQNSITRYICCIDPDDTMDPEFIRACIEELDKDNTLGIAYTGITAVFQDGHEERTPWPPVNWSFDEQIAGRNQIPTCCVFRREMWQRLGGYHQYYAPTGCGSEDAEFWTRAGAYGWKAKQASQAGLFHYSYMSGYTAKQDYHEVNWLQYHPWSFDEIHPFASMAKPKNGYSHPVKQYDNPLISVIIPVGPGHEHIVTRALDSLEAQTFRRWEVILSWDSALAIPYIITDAYPYAKIVKGKKPKQGAGAARNLGVKNSRGSFVLFLDADDWLYSEALDKMLDGWNYHQGIVYSDYTFSVKMDGQEAEKVRARVKSYNPATQTAIMSHSWIDYDCQKFQQTVIEARENIINNNLFHWCLVTCLIPRVWHDEIGGFDETMKSWEDVDYYWRMGWAGMCFTRVPEPLIRYNFDTGTRRSIANAETTEAREIGIELLEYMIKKLEAINPMACRSCGSKGTFALQANLPVSTDAFAVGIDAEMVKVEYVADMSGRDNKGQHGVVGMHTFNQPIPNIRMKNKGGGWVFDYGYRSCGEVFYVHKMDINDTPFRFRVIPEAVIAPPVAEPVPTPEPVAISEVAKVKRKK
jgi:glycosyltransferase involved in cell wall biosynthesis